jgi:predicted membrane chloride channel (bestrophin family)
MESLALLVTVILIAIYSSGFIAFIASWFKNHIALFVAKSFGIVAIVSGVWLGFTLRDGNGFFVGSIPVLLGSFAIWNSRHRWP